MQRVFKRFLRQQAGSVLILTAVTMLGVVGLVGLAVDVGRVQMAHSKLQNAIDAAALAAGATSDPDDAEAVFNKYLAINFDGTALGVRLTSKTVTVSENGQNIHVSATAELSGGFLTLLGIGGTANFAGESEITRSSKGLELAMVLDTTGSMCDDAGCTKITALKSSAKAMLDILFGDESTLENLWIGIVPFSQAVNVGTSHTSWLDAAHYADLDWGNTSWAGCVEARYLNGRDETDAVPADEPFKAYYWDDNIITGINANDWMKWQSSDGVDTTLCNKNDNTCTCSTYGPCATTYSKQHIKTVISCDYSSGHHWEKSSCTKTVTPPTYYAHSNRATTGPSMNCPAQITPLTNTKITLVNAIDALQPYGYTHIPVGAVWGWRLISPNWRGVWGGDMDTNQLPLDYHTPLMSKAVIIMTDGTNTMDNAVDGAYGFLGDGLLGTTNKALAEGKLDSKLTRICNAMKAEDIIVYTILFKETDSGVQTLLKQCATTEDHYFFSPDGSTLASAFQTIGDSLANLRITQ